MKIFHHDKPLIIILLLTLLGRGLYLQLQYPLWWDSHIYIAMGKFIASNGGIGFWEWFRAPFHPLFLGLIGKMGFSIIIFGKIFDIIWSLGAVYFFYRIAEHLFERRIALVGSIIFSFTPVFIMLSGLMLAEPLAVFLALAGVWAFLRQRFFWTGILLALSFLTRFHFGVWIIAVLCSLLLEQGRWKEKFHSLLTTMGGFIVPVSAYLISNQLLWGKALKPFTEAQVLVDSAVWFYERSAWLYVERFFLACPLYLFVFMYGYLFFRNKEWRNTKKTMLVVVTILTFAYFLSISHKEVRYLMTALPALAMMAAAGIVWTYDYLRRTSSAFIKPKSFVVLCIVALLLPLPFELSFERPPQFHNEIGEILGENESRAMIVSTDPSLGTYLTSTIVTLDGTPFAAEIYARHKGKYDVVYIGDCDLQCHPQNQTCLDQKHDFWTTVREENELVLEKNWTFRENDVEKRYSCTYMVFVPKN